MRYQRLVIATGDADFDRYAAKATVMNMIWKRVRDSGGRLGGWLDDDDDDLSVGN
jgi:hypothetical protein